MNDRQRLEQLVHQLQSLEGLDEKTYEMLSREVERTRGHFGLDSDGRLKVAFFDAKRFDRESFDRHNHDRFALQYIPAALSAGTLPAAEGCRAVCLFVNDCCNADVVAGLAARGVETIALRAAGFNNVDLQACRQHGISVTRVPAYSPYAVAEHTVALMLMLNRRLHQAYLRNRAGYFVLDGLTGFDMRGKTVGVIGTGKIGACVAHILRGFGCRLLAHDRHPNEELLGHDVVQYTSLEDLLRLSDIVTLHVPLFPETHHLINHDTIARMKDGVMLINTSRGALVDTPALIAGLKSRKIGFAGLDVYEEEAGVFFHDMSGDVLTDDVLARLLTFNNVVVTSHQAFLTREALDNIAQTTLENLAEYAAGRRGEQLTNAV